MDAIDPKAWRRVPLAETVLTLWRFMADDEQLESLFERHRQRCYTRVLSFSTLVHLMKGASRFCRCYAALVNGVAKALFPQICGLLPICAAKTLVLTPLPSCRFA